MSQADDIRSFVIEHWIAPARHRADAQVIVRAGDVHSDMKLKNALPAVCSAIGSQIFLELSGVEQIDRQGPANGANVTWTFKLSSPSRIDKRALEVLKAKFLEHYPDFQRITFAGSEGGYWDEERHYKQTLIDAAHEALASTPSLPAALLGQRLLSILADKPSNLLNWRVLDRLDEIRKAHPNIVETASGDLARSVDEPAAAIGTFVKKIWPLFAQGHEENLPYGDIRALPSALLALAKPETAIFARYQRFHNAGVMLFHRSIFANGPLTETEYSDVLSMARQIFDVMRDEWRWSPRDLWDVQGFIWSTCKTRAESSAGAEASTIEEDMETVETPSPTNLIFYGPPGTGKTYATAERAVSLCDGSLPQGGRSAIMERYRELVARKRIEFVTFHQSYSYEEFVEGLRPETGVADGTEGNAGSGFRLEPRPGIFRAIADRASADRGAVTQGLPDIAGRDAFKMSLGRSDDDEGAYLFEDAIAGGYVHLGYGGDINWADPIYAAFDAIKLKWREVEPQATGSDPNIQQIYALRSWMKNGDLVIISDGNKRFRAIGEITGPYRYVERQHDTFHHQRPVKWLWIRREGLPREEIYDKAFSQVSIYHLNSKYLKWPALDQVISGGKTSAEQGRPPPYVLIIDEINRANISKVFGELITLLEPDKRLGAENAISVTLPYSKASFGVPLNLHIIGTMNTADRSIALLDMALRRRFDFEELTPDATLLSTDIEGVDLRAAFVGLNARIEYLFDRDHQIGHAYFLGCKTFSDIEAVMRSKVIPLLVEYFYENWEKVRRALNETGDDGAFIMRTRLVGQLSGWDEPQPDYERWRYAVRRSFSKQAFSQLAG